MKAIRYRTYGFLAVVSLCLASPAAAQCATPTITHVRTEGTNLEVTVAVPAGLQRVTLESSDRVGRHGWTPRVVNRPNARAGVLTFRLPMSRACELIRVRGDTSELLPAAFYSGTNTFSAPSDTSSTTGWFDAGGNGGSVQSGSVRDVVESDIWQVRENTLYFFNQYRGLQVIDITHPDAAWIRGTLPLPAAGEQMYLLSSNHVVLLARNGCDYDTSQIVIVADTNGPPAIAARLVVPGTFIESRLVGTALYVASQLSRPISSTNDSVWEWGTLVCSFDLSDPGVPVARDTLWFPGYGNVVNATDTYLFVVTQVAGDWWQSVVHCIDITDARGAIAAFGSVTTAGQILDKFKISYGEGVLAVVSEDWHNTSNRVLTRLETFRLPDPRLGVPSEIAKLGRLELGNGERLRATRFDGNRVYIVTFFQIDPLWVVDFSEPTAPRIAGSVEVPGWSTYIEPLGDRLVAVGVETNQVAVSLFNVADPAAPALLSRVRLGSHYSWSEANYDEKAFTILRGAGLLLLPFSSDTTNGYASVLQLIDYSPTALTPRGQVSSESGLSYRRAMAYGDRILSLTGWELVSVDAHDRDHPLVAGRLSLANAVDRVILAGEYLIELSGGNGWDVTTPVVSVASPGAPDRALTRLALMPLPLLGATKHDGRLYVAQGSVGWSGNGSNRPLFALTVATVTNLPSLTVLSQSITNVEEIGWTRTWEGLWPKPNVLVWAGGQDSWWCMNCLLGATDGFVGGQFWYWPYWRGNSGGNGRLIAFDATDPDAPCLASRVDLTATNRWGFSRAWLADGLVYLSHQTSELKPNPSGGTWIYRSFLDVVDFSDPPDPIVRDPVSIPNPLVGVSDSGALLYTLGTHWQTDPGASFSDYLDACAYDGVAAHLVDSLALPQAWPHPVLVLDTNVLVGIPATMDGTNVLAATLETWALSPAGKFNCLGSLNLKSSSTSLQSFPGLVAAGLSNSSVSLFDARKPATLRLVGDDDLPLCGWWPDLGHADADAVQGLWIPLSAYGLAHIPVKR